ncbi:hypothetical protein NQ315_007478 [Exocentrus adspersus]|uniref:Uncharacterized protein n=1 Tax=Exocentrus adspersus TaxID=1586481 RepID=A0AAV8V835_9CUCU|nr:hypothetical protein NQ315_007478 [Exocentrus adspersus]
MKIFLRVLADPGYQNADPAHRHDIHKVIKVQ